MTNARSRPERLAERVVDVDADAVHRPVREPAADLRVLRDPAGSVMRPSFSRPVGEHGAARGGDRGRRAPELRGGDAGFLRLAGPARRSRAARA